MPAVTVESVLGLPRIPRPASLRPRPVVQLAEATPTTESARFKVWRSFPGGGGVIGGGDTQWMTAGSGILHDELPTERLYRQGGLVHHVQMWFNLPAALKMTGLRYQPPISGHQLALVTTGDGGALVRNSTPPARATPRAPTWTGGPPLNGGVHHRKGDSNA